MGWGSYVCVAGSRVMRCSQMLVACQNLPRQVLCRTAAATRPNRWHVLPRRPRQHAPPAPITTYHTAVGGAAKWVLTVEPGARHYQSGPSSTRGSRTKDDAEWKDTLTAAEFYVLREKGTEPAGSGQLNSFYHKPGLKHSHTQARHTRTYIIHHTHLHHTSM